MTKGEAAGRLVEMAVQMLSEDPGFLLINGLRGEDVCLRADISQTTFYRHFNKHSFIDAVANHIVPGGTVPPADAVGRAVGPFVSGDSDPRTEIRRQVISQFTTVRDHPNTTRRFLALLLGKSRQDTRTRLQQSYARRDAIRAEVLRALFESWGASPRGPFTVHHAAVAMDAVLEGLVLRWRVDPDAVPDWLIGEVSVALVAALVDTEQRGEYIDDVANAFAAGIERTRETSGTAAGLPADPRTALVAAAREEMAQRGYALATVDAIAARAHVPAPLAKKLFPTKQHIVVNALARPVGQLRESVADDQAIGHEPLAVIERHLLRFARFVSDERVMVDALIAILSAQSRSEPTGLLDMRTQIDLPDLISDAIAEAQLSGALVDKIGPRELAEALTDNMLVRCFNKRDESPADAAGFVQELVLTGALPR